MTEQHEACEQAYDAQRLEIEELRKQLATVQQEAKEAHQRGFEAARKAIEDMAYNRALSSFGDEIRILPYPSDTVRLSDVGREDG